MVDEHLRFQETIRRGYYYKRNDKVTVVIFYSFPRIYKKNMFLFAECLIDLTFDEVSSNLEMSVFAVKSTSS